jgi:group II intron reverse transcriptase/maturase
MVDVIQELGHLKKLAKEDHDKRFNRLYRLLRQEQFLEIAKQGIANNKGARTPGVDGKTIDEVTSQEITRLSRELAEGRYQPQPVRRHYIPKPNGKLRPLGIPTSRDKVIQSGVALILNTIYEPIFRNCSHGFRPERSPITALRQVWSAFRAGATWIIEGDITDCFGSLPHQVILNCLRKRIRDERFIDLICKMLQAGIMEADIFKPTFSGAPQGGIASPILSNVVLHELDSWMEDHLNANPPPESNQERFARHNPRYTQLQDRITYIRRCLDGKRPISKRTSPEELRQELREKLRLRQYQPCCLPRKVVYFIRFADDFVAVLCHHSKQEAKFMKATIAAWMLSELGLPLNLDKTHITHWKKRFRFLGYDLQGCCNLNGTRWLHLRVPREALRRVITKVKRATAYPQAPEYDVFTNVNAVARGWSNYYRYAHNISSIGSKLSSIIFWLTLHYLGKKRRRSLNRLMRTHYDRHPKTGYKTLFTYRPGNLPSTDHRYYLWHKAPRRLSLASIAARHVQDKPAHIDTNWAIGHSRHKRIQTRTMAGNKCQCCGTANEDLFVHHSNRLRNPKRVSKGSRNVAQSGLLQHTKLLCFSCHLAHHHGNFCN